MGRKMGHLSVATVTMAPKHSLLQVRRLQAGALRVDLRDFLPVQKQFWWATEVDQIVSVLEKTVVMGSVRFEVPRRAHRGYEVLHVMPAALSTVGFDEEVTAAIRRIVDELF